MTAATLFYRQSLKERGHFSNYPTLNPVIALGFGPTSLHVKRRLGTFEVPYGVLTAKVREDYIAKV